MGCMNCSVLFLLMYIKELKAEKQIMRSVTGKRLCSRHVFTALPPSLACPQCCSQIWQQYNSVLQRQRHPELQPGVCGKTCRGLNQHIWCLFLPTHHMGIVILIQTEHHIRLKRLSLERTTYPVVLWFHILFITSGNVIQLSTWKKGWSRPLMIVRSRRGLNIPWSSQCSLDFWDISTVKPEPFSDFQVKLPSPYHPIPKDDLLTNY